jgi:hypothetical protein
MLTREMMLITECDFFEKRNLLEMNDEVNEERMEEREESGRAARKDPARRDRASLFDTLSSFFILLSSFDRIDNLLFQKIVYPVNVFE